MAIRAIISRRLGTKCVKTKYKNWVMVDIGVRQILEGGTSIEALSDADEVIVEKYLICTRVGRGGKLRIAMNTRGASASRTQFRHLLSRKQQAQGSMGCTQALSHAQPHRGIVSRQQKRTRRRPGSSLERALGSRQRIVQDGGSGIPLLSADRHQQGAARSVGRPR